MSITVNMARLQILLVCLLATALSVKAATHLAFGDTCGSRVDGECGENMVCFEPKGCKGLGACLCDDDHYKDENNDCVAKLAIDAECTVALLNTDCGLGATCDAADPVEPTGKCTCVSDFEKKDDVHCKFIGDIPDEECADTFKADPEDDDVCIASTGKGLDETCTAAADPDECGTPFTCPATGDPVSCGCGDDTAALVYTGGKLKYHVCIPSGGEKDISLGEKCTIADGDYCDKELTCATCPGGGDTTYCRKSGGSAAVSSVFMLLACVLRLLF